MEEKKVLEEAKDVLLSLREVCVKELLNKKDILEKGGDGEFDRLLSVAKEMMVSEKINSLLSKAEEQEQDLQKWKEYFERRINDNIHK